MSLYSAIQFTSVSFLYSKGSNLGDFQFLFIDLLLILPIAVFMGWAGPAETLCRKRPTADLVSRKVLVPLLGLMGISIVIQAITYVTVREQPWYVPPELNRDESNIKSSENTALFLVSCFEYIFSGVILNAGPPFRHPLWENCESHSPPCISSSSNYLGPFITTIILSLAATMYMIADPARWLNDLMELSGMSWDYKLFLGLLGIAYFALAWVYEKFLSLRLARLLGAANEWITGRAKGRKQYKLIQENMNSYVF